MSIVTISREYGSAGRTVAEQVADRLGYENIDKELLVHVAQEARVPLSEVERFDEQPEHPALRILRKFLTPGYADTLTGLSEYEWWATATVPELSSQSEKALATLDEEIYVKLTQEVISKLAEQGNVVLLGRGSQALLSERSDTLHVRIVADQEFKIETTMERDGVTRDEALKRARKVDEKRKLYIKRHYNVAWDNARHYHLTINTGLFGINGAAQTIVEAVRRLPLKPVGADGD